MQVILIGLGIVCIIYFLIIAFIAGHGMNFYFIWLCAGAALIGLGICMQKDILLSHIPVWIKRLFLVGVCVGGIFFAIIEGCIIAGGITAKGRENLDYIIVLGAQMKTSGPSRVLKMRLDKAYDYLTENSDTYVIVSGAQGSNEPVSEAQGMRDYLVKRGIDKNCIIMEDKSCNTNQNINYSSAFLDKEKDSVGIVTNNFHIFRAMHIAKKCGFKEVYGIAAPSEPFLQANNMVREFFGVVKDFLVGNI